MSITAATTHRNPPTKFDFEKDRFSDFFQIGNSVASLPRPGRNFPAPQQKGAESSGRLRCFCRRRARLFRPALVVSVASVSRAFKKCAAPIVASLGLLCLGRFT